MSRVFLMPTKIILGEGALKAAQSGLCALGQKALIVCGPITASLGYAEEVAALLAEGNVSSAVFSAIAAEPTDEMIEEGLRAFVEEGCDFLVAIGGGSPIDAMKAIAMRNALGGTLRDYIGKPVTCKLAPMAAIPTTAGTGSEATQFTIITDVKTQVKMLLAGPGLLPDLAIVDHAYSVSAPPNITAATGIDALTHAMEAFTSKKAQPLSDLFALSAAKRIFGNLKKAYDCPQDLSAREQMAIGALEAGVAFNNASVTVVHGMSRPIGALFHIPHGVSNAMLLEACFRYVCARAPERFAELSRFLGFADESMRDEAAAVLLIERTAALLKEIKIPSLLEYGVDRKEFENAIAKMSSDAMNSKSPANTRIPLCAEDLAQIYKTLI